MWFDGIRQPNTLYVANTSRGKDSTAMLRAIQLMGWPLDMICAVDIWATQDIPAELPPMVAFKDEYDKKVFDWFGVPVTRLCATQRERERETASAACPTPICSTERLRVESIQGQSKDSLCNAILGARNLSRTKLTYEDIFYRKLSPKRERERALRRGRNPDGDFRIYGFPMQRGAWCNSDLKRAAMGSQSVLSETGVPPSKLCHQGISLEERRLVSRQTQRKLARPGF